MKKFIIQDDYGDMLSHNYVESLIDMFPEIIINPNIPYVGLANHNRDYLSYNNELVENLYEYLVDILIQDDGEEEDYDNDYYHVTHNKLTFIIKDIREEYGIELSWQDIFTLFTPKLLKENNCINLTEDDMYDFIGNILMKALASKYQDGDYETTCINGCMQGDWIDILYPEKLEYVISEMEASFFDMGKEVHLIDDDNDEDYWDYIPISCPSDEEIEKYVRDRFDAEDGDEIIYMKQETRVVNVEERKMIL